MNERFYSDTGSPGLSEKRDSAASAADMRSKLSAVLAYAVTDIPTAIEELAKRFTIVSTTDAERLNSIRRWLSENPANHFFADKALVAVLRNLTAPMPVAPSASVVPDASHSLRVLADALGCASTAGAVSIAVGALQLAVSIPARQVTAAVPLLACNEPITSDFRRAAAAIGIPVTNTPMMPTASDWLAGLPRVYPPTIAVPRWFLDLVAEAGQPVASNAQVAEWLEGLIAEHAQAGRFLAAWWSRELRCFIATLGPESGVVPSELSCARAVGALKGRA